MRKVNINDAFFTLEDPDLSVPLPTDKAVDKIADFTSLLPAISWSASPSPMSTIRNSSVRQSADFAKSTKPGFPQILLRLWRNKLNPTVMKALVHCQATYKISDNDIKGTS